jgi:glycosyltransferase involved in cell wall biosynthesis
MRLLILSRFDECGAGPRYRFYQFLSLFEQKGIRVEIQALLDKKYLNSVYSNQARPFTHLFKIYAKRAWFLLLNKNRYDVVFMDSELFPYVPFFLERWFLPKKYFIDQDDAVFHRYDTHQSFWIRKLFGGKIAKVIRNSQGIIVGNTYLKEHAVRAGMHNVVVLTTTVDAQIYKPQVESLKPGPDAVIIGWVGSPTTVRYLELIKPALIAVAKKRNIILSVVGASYALPGVTVHSQNWVDGWNEQEEIALTNKIDIGIMPVIDGPFERGKCGFKIIKYMACAKPVIASPVGLDPGIVDHGKNGYIATSLAEWEEYLLLLIDDAQRRENFGRYGREKMLEKYSLQAAFPALYDFLIRAYQHNKN